MIDPSNELSPLVSLMESLKIYILMMMMMMMMHEAIPVGIEPKSSHPQLMAGSSVIGSVVYNSLLAVLFVLWAGWLRMTTDVLG